MADTTTSGRRASVGAGGYKIRAKAKTDDGQHSARWDAAGWFAQAADDDIADLHAVGYKGDEADELAYYAHETEGNKGLATIFKYLSVYKPRTPNGYIVGFEVVLNPLDVFNYLKTARPDLCRSLFRDEPEFREC